jgi:hypothetical protein
VSTYLLDANVFIQAKNLHYGFDFCPAFWQWLIERHEGGTVASIEKVADEIRVVDDDLKAWVDERAPTFFAKPDQAVVDALPVVSEWAAGQHYERAAVSTFLQVADYWLVGHAMAHGCIVVTHEVPAKSARKIKIPNACVELGIACVTPFEMLRREQARFVLGPTG